MCAVVCDIPPCSVTKPLYVAFAAYIIYCYVLNCGSAYWFLYVYFVGLKALPSVRPGADPGVQAVSPQVTFKVGRLPLVSARHAVTFPC